MKSFFTGLIQMGVMESHSTYLRNKIRLSNIVALIIIFCVAVPFLIISLIFFKPLVIIPVLGVVICLAAMFINHLGLIYLGRTIIALVPICLVAIYNAGLATVGETPVVGTYIVEVSFSFVPFVIFDLREKIYLYTLAALSALLIMSFDYTNSFLELQIDNTIIRGGFLGNLSVFIGLITGFGSLLVLVYQNRLSERKTELLLEEAEKNHLKMFESENELKSNLEAIRQAQVAEKQRQWISEGLAEITKLFQQYNHLQEVCDNLLTYLVKYLQASQGGLFLTHEADEQKYLELTAAYAYNRKKYVEKKIAIKRCVNE